MALLSAQPHGPIWTTPSQVFERREDSRPLHGSFAAPQPRSAIIDVAGLGFLGLGPGDPRIAEWGEMLTESSSFLQNYPYMIFFTGAAIVISAVGFNLLGDGLREALDPRLKR